MFLLNYRFCQGDVMLTLRNSDMCIIMCILFLFAACLFVTRIGGLYVVDSLNTTDGVT